MTDPVTVERRGAVAVVTVDNPPVNAISQAVRAGLLARVREAADDPAVEAVVLACAGRTFMAGADIREFGKPLEPPTLPDVIEAIEGAPKPVVAALHGTALGGGLETALGCHHRVASPDARVGFPEVNLGLLPGAGGTQRAPRLMGVEAALDLMVSGRPIGARDAHAAGLVDALVEGDLLDAAVEAARRLAAAGTVRRTRDLDLDYDAVPEGFFDRYRESIARRTRGLFAPERIVRSVENALALSFVDGIRAERALFAECMASPQSAALRHVFFAEREVARIPGVGAEVRPREVARVGVVGAGTMGGGIAMALANAGLPVVVVETEREALDRGLATMRANWEATARKGRLTEAEVERRAGLVEGGLDLAAVADCDSVIEAVFEDLALKRDVFARLDAAVRPGALLATNTSTLDVDAIAAATARPGDVLGLHFFSPANVMRLLEVVRGRETAPDVLATAMALARRIGKVGVVSGVCYGFIGNRMLEGYLREAQYLVLEGAAPRDVDAVAYGFGFPMGPHAMMDLAGVDVGWRIRKERRAAGDLPDDPRFGALFDRIAEAGRYGQKTQAGVYRYEPGSRTPVPDPEVTAIAEREAQRLGIERRAIETEEILDRLLLPLVDEGARILAEGIAIRPGDVDVVWINGYGFPAYRGGPMFWADAMGLAAVRARIGELAARLGNAHGEWTPAPLLDELAGAGSTFDEWSRARG